MHYFIAPFDISAFSRKLLHEKDIPTKFF